MGEGAREGGRKRKGRRGRGGGRKGDGRRWKEGEEGRREIDSTFAKDTLPTCCRPPTS